ncbi:hypothetical protein [Chitinolyticbacter albus]|uniref:hypothetical protein n=1 Tax=Chitinolyticbacter albus TaxID=2961951 RepID=UPI00210B6A53|nr:hypothetical protein [Chitinolyticbacter albus]
MRAAFFPLLLLVLPLFTVAKGKVPSHFSDQVEAALTCRSEFSPTYWQDYFRLHLGQPLRTWGEAEWFDSQGALLAGNPSEEVFVNVTDSGALMVGALFETKVETVRSNIETRLSIAFTPLPGPYPRYLSKFGSVLVGLSNGHTKWYCARWHLGNRP